MRRTALVVVALAAVGMLAGCASSVPEWVTKESGAYPGDQGNAVYAVGLAGADPNPQMQRDLARMNGREEIARITNAYVAELTKHFVQSHKDYYNEETASSVQFYQQAAKQVTEARLYGSRVVETWMDAGGDNGPAGTLYVLMMLPLDNSFFDAYQEKVKDIIRQQQAQLLKVQADEALKALDEELEKTRANPFGNVGGAMPAE